MNEYFNAEVSRFVRRYGEPFIKLLSIILKSKATTKTYMMFLDRVELTSREVERATQLSGCSVWRALKKLNSLGLIEENGKEPRPHKCGGPKATIWRLRT